VDSGAIDSQGALFFLLMLLLDGERRCWRTLHLIILGVAAGAGLIWGLYLPPFPDCTQRYGVYGFTLVWWPVRSYWSSGRWRRAGNVLMNEPYHTLIFIYRRLRHLYPADFRFSLSIVVTEKSVTLN